MTRVFDGTFKHFQDRLRTIGIFGKWEEHPNGVWRLKTKCGSTLSWSDTRRTYWLQCKPEQQEYLDNLLAGCFDDDPRDYRLVVIGNEDTMPYDQIVTMLNAAGLDVISTKA